MDFPPSPDIRWQQRFQSFERALAVLTRTLVISQPNEAELLGQVQAFEFTFELAWKVLKDYLTAQEIPANFPRDVLKTAVQYELLADGEAWMNMLEKRNLMANTYDEARADEAAGLIQNAFYPAFRQLHTTLLNLRTDG